ncbi:Protein HEAT INTOLERANT 4 [Turnera subulata]|uniref:Protein HEAT INTOLERANT 4 n=1 Tax=Turnera subulata TaxID=218843 RepID=A0A9Q0FTJ4_9ROSI|nr:Protein HEAT INTOLERANT 4 [Turnera subulata]
MKKGASKRKRNQKDKDTAEEDIKEEQNQKPDTAKPEPPPAKRSRTAAAPSKAAPKPKPKPKPKPEPEYFEEQRNLEDLWKAAIPIGMEWDQLDAVYKYNWNFSNLEDAFEEGGVLHDKKVYLFVCSEPQLVPFKGENLLTVIPVVVAIVSPFPPSDKIGIKSVQRVSEDIVPMKQMKMDWVPYIPLENRDRQVDRLKSQIYILGCTQRRSALKHLKVDRVREFEYCLPYLYQPFKEDEVEQSTVVQILFPAEEKPVFCEFDWEFDEVEEFTDKLIDEEELSEDQRDAFKEFVKEKVREAKKANREAREARKKALAEMSEETKKAFENMKFYKFYPVPTPDTPDVSKVKSPFINRYYGTATQVL